MSHHCKDSKCHSDRKKEGGCVSKPISQCLINKAKGNLAILKSGKYHLTEDVVGTISIQSSNVCVDLCCHTLDAEGADNAIVVGLPDDQQGASSVNRKVDNRKVLSRHTLVDSTFDISGKDVDNLKRKVTGNKTELVRYESANHISTKSLADSGVLSHIRIGNGSVVGSSEDGILVNKVFDLEVSNLTMETHSLNGININDSDSVKVHDISLYGGDDNSVGERALRVVDTDNFDISNLNITGYTATVGSLVELESCLSGSLTNTNVSNNITNGDSFFDYAGSLVTLSLCSGVTLKKVKVYENVFDSVSEGNNHLAGIYLSDSPNCSVIDCEVCENVDASPDNDGALTIFLSIIFSDNTIINGCKVNNNLIENGHVFDGDGVGIYSSSYVLCENTQVNGNTYNNIDWFAAHGMWSVARFSGSESKEVTYRNCQVKNNNVLSGDITGASSYIGIRVNSANNVVEDCDLSNNNVFSDAAQFISGFICSGGSTNTRLVNVKCDNNDCPDVISYSALGDIPGAAGFNVHAGTVEMVNCSANSNGNAGLISYGDIPIQCTGCTFKRNGTVTQKLIGAGISLSVFGESGRLIVKDCLIQQNGDSQLVERGYGIEVNPGRGNSLLVQNTDILETYGSVLARGIYGTNLSDVVIDGVTVRRTGNVEGTGILLENVSNSKIINSQVFSSNNNGIELDDLSQNVLIQDCHSIGNSGAGFVDNSVNGNTWLGNKGINNLLGSYSGIAVGNIVTYDNSTGTYNSPPYSTSNIDAF